MCHELVTSNYMILIYPEGKMDILLRDAILSWLINDEAVHHGVPTQHKDENEPICTIQGLNWTFR